MPLAVLLLADASRRTDSATTGLSYEGISGSVCFLICGSRSGLLGRACGGCRLECVDSIIGCPLTLDMFPDHGPTRGCGGFWTGGHGGLLLLGLDIICV